MDSGRKYGLNGSGNNAWILLGGGVFYLWDQYISVQFGAYPNKNPDLAD